MAAKSHASGAYAQRRRAYQALVKSARTCSSSEIVVVGASVVEVVDVELVDVELDDAEVVDLDVLDGDAATDDSCRAGPASHAVNAMAAVMRVNRHLMRTSRLVVRRNVYHAMCAPTGPRRKPGSWSILRGPVESTVAMYAVIATGGKQERVAEGQQVRVELLGVEDGAEVSFAPVLLVDGDRVLATPTELEGAKVTGRVVGSAKGPKIDGFTYKRRTNQRRRYGHRQQYSVVEILSIGTSKK